LEGFRGGVWSEVGAGAVILDREVVGEGGGMDQEVVWREKMRLGIQLPDSPALLHGMAVLRGLGPRG
jgi:hypothetical protein